MELKVLLTITVIMAIYMVVGGIIIQKIESADESGPLSTEILVHLPIVDNETAILSMDEVKRLLEKTVDRLRSTHSTSNWELELTIVDIETARANGHVDEDADHHNKTADEHDQPKPTAILQTMFRGRRHNPWSLYDAIFFAQTVVTTIGYGSTTPITPSGRAFCCVYAIFGIPLIGIWMAGVGELIFSHVEKLRKKRHIKKRLRTWFLFGHFVATITAGSAIFVFFPSILFSAIEGWSYVDAIYYSIMSLTTIGLGDLVAGVKEDSPHWYRILLNLWLLLGLGWLSMLISLLMGMIRTRATIVIKKASEKVVFHIKRRASVGMPRTMSFAGVREISVFLSQSQRTRSCSSPPSYLPSVRRSVSLRNSNSKSVIKQKQLSNFLTSRRTSSLPFLSMQITNEQQQYTMSPPDVECHHWWNNGDDTTNKTATNEKSKLDKKTPDKKRRRISFFIGSSHRSSKVAPVPDGQNCSMNHGGSLMMTPIKAQHRHKGFQTPILVYDKKLRVPDRRLSHVTAQGIIERVDETTTPSFLTRPRCPSFDGRNNNNSNNSDEGHAEC